MYHMVFALKGGDKGGEDAATSAVDDVLSIVDGEEVGGVVFSTVATRRPELKRELGILRQALLLEEQADGGGGDGGSEELKVRTEAMFHAPPYSDERIRIPCPHTKPWSLVWVRTCDISDLM